MEPRTVEVGSGIEFEARKDAIGTNDVPVKGLMRHVLEAFEQERVRYCVLRDADRLDRQSGEVDLLVDPKDVGRLEHVLGPLSFVRLKDEEYAAHRLFLAYDSESDGWLKLDVIDRLEYGHRKVLGTSLTERCLNDRRRFGLLFIPSPEAELVALLFHCVLGKRSFDQARRDRCRALCTEITDLASLSAMLTTYWSPAMTAARLIQTIQDDNWATLLTEKPTGAVSKRSISGYEIARAGRGVLRRVGRRLPALRPRTLTVALLAPDGAGKTTLVHAIHESFQVPVRSLYMGLWRRGSHSLSDQRLPGMGFVFRLFRLWTRYLVACYHRAYGRFVIFDRYVYDAMLPSRKPLSWHSRCRRWLLARACPAPDLLIVLDAPGEVLFGRKGEHNIALLEQQRRAYLRLATGPGRLVVDATRDAERVRREVTSFIWSAYTSQTPGERSQTTSLIAGKGTV
jgi:thymidylate kinase